VHETVHPANNELMDGVQRMIRGYACTMQPQQHTHRDTAHRASNHGQVRVIIIMADLAWWVGSPPRRLTSDTRARMLRVPQGPTPTISQSMATTSLMIRWLCGFAPYCVAIGFRAVPAAATLAPCSMLTLISCRQCRHA
jgi:hypothetical protein